MKKFTKLLVVALSLVLLVGAIVGVSATAADDEITYTASPDDLIVSTNVSYADKLQLYFAIDVTHTTFKTTNKNTVTSTGKTSTTSTVYDAGTIDSIVCKIGDKTYDLTAEPEKITINGHNPVYIVKTPGIAPKDILSEVTLTVNITGSTVTLTSTDGENPQETDRKDYHYTDTVTYSVAEYFFERLYDDGIINATSEVELAQKELYLATLAYADAAQELLAPEATKTLDDMIYVWGDVNLGLTEKGDYYINLSDKLYSYTCYGLEGATAEPKVASGTGYFTLNESVCIEAIDPAISNEGPEDAAVNFDSLTASDDNLITQANTNIAVGSGNGGISSVTVNSQLLSLGNATIRNNGAGNYLRLEKNNWKNGQMWVNFNTNTSTFAEGDTAFMFQTRVRFNQIADLHEDQQSNSIGNFRFRFYWKDESGTNRLDNYISAREGGKVVINLAKDSSTEAYTSSINANEWFTLRYVITVYDATNNPNNLKAYIMNEETGKFTMVKEASYKVVTDLSLLNNVRLMESTDLWGYADFDYVYSDFVADANNISVDLPANTEKATPEVTVTPDNPTQSVAKDGVVEAGVVTTDNTTVKNTTDGTSNSASHVDITTFGDESFLRAYKDNTATLQTSVQFNKASDEGEGNVVVFETKMRIGGIRGLTSAASINSGYQLRVMDKSGARHSNVFLDVSSGKVCLGEAASTADIGEWFTLKVTYTYTAADAEAGTAATAVITMTITDSEGVSTDFTEIAFVGDAVSANEIAGFRMTSYVATKMIVDFKDASFAVTNSAAYAE